MALLEPSNRATPKAEVHLGEDRTGRDRLSRNLAFAWGGYAVNVFAGFVMPRLIADRLGQTTLGIWDFSWSVVSYFGLVQLGIGSSVNRYVARYRATGDNEGLSRSVSTIGLSLKVSAFLAAVLAIGAAIWIVPLFSAKLGTSVNTAQLVVLFLGFEVAGSLMLAVHGAIIVGCHRWDLHNSISAVSYAVMLLAMVLVILAGGGLTALALVHWMSINTADVVRWRVARRLCPEVVMDFRLATWATWSEQARYSAKSLVPRIADLVSNQSLALLITVYLGPAALAVYSRPRNLTRQAQSVSAKFGSMLVPTASSLQARTDKAELLATFLKATRFISSLMMPAVLSLTVLGDEVIRIWMGGAFVVPGLIAILAIGSLPTLIQEPVWSILAGMNRHGEMAKWKLAGAATSAVFLGLGFGFFHLNLLGAALAFAVPQAIVDGAIAPVLACRVLRTPVSNYYRNTYLRPAVSSLVYVSCLVAARLTFDRILPLCVLFSILSAVILAIIFRNAFAGMRD